MSQSKPYYRYFFVERKIRVIMVLFLLLCGVLVVQMYLLHHKQLEVQLALEDQKLVDSIPQLEEEIERRTPEPVVEIVEEPVEPVVEEEITLQGIFYSDGTYWAVLNREPHPVGGMAGNYLIVDISKDAVKLQHNETLKMKTLHLGVVDDSGVIFYEK